MSLFAPVDKDEVNKVDKEPGIGRVYALRFILADGTVLHKVGMCHSDRSVDRMMEVLRGFFTAYRYIPECRLKRDREYKAPLLVEKHLHELLSDLSYTFDKSFGGSTEFFADVDEDLLLDYIDNFDEKELLADYQSMDVDSYESLSDKQEPDVGSLQI